MRRAVSGLDDGAMARERDRRADGLRDHTPFPPGESRARRENDGGASSASARGGARRQIRPDFNL